MGIAYIESTEHFLPHSEDSRVLFEEGAEDFSNIIADHMDDSIAMVESIHSEMFSEEVLVHICATLECYEKHTTMRKSRGATIGDKVFLSPKLLARPKTTKSVLAHELSHLHLAQKLGGLTLYNNVPGWFQEGLATFVSEGGGAEKVSISDAEKALKSQSFFIPDINGSIFRMKNADSYGFTENYSDPFFAQNMYYRQSSMFVAYLKRTNITGFNRLMFQILSGVTFEKAFIENYDLGLEDTWYSFINEIKT
ncbi:MAG: hypothetical protein COA99_07045 [Moraxellaceae bacterium]|nr:MAG: hypothetical protein COA99_07045 [Moraxellaceae bacterium]